MSLSRLVAFGCSNTYGASLDIYPEDFNIINPSQFAWPQILSELLKLRCVNQGVRGASNKQILHNILNFEFEENDIVFVCWTHTERSCIICSDEIIHLLPRFKHSKNTALRKKNESFYRHIYNPHDRIIECFFYYNLASYHLKTKQIEHRFTLYEPHAFAVDIPWNRAPFLNTFFARFSYDYPKALDGRHPGKEAHQKFALEIANRYLRNDYYTIGKEPL